MEPLAQPLQDILHKSWQEAFAECVPNFVFQVQPFSSQTKQFQHPLLQVRYQVFSTEFKVLDWQGLPSPGKVVWNTKSGLLVYWEVTLLGTKELPSPIYFFTNHSLDHSKEKDEISSGLRSLFGIEVRK